MKKAFGIISVTIMAVAVGMLIFFSLRQGNRQDWDVCYEMANRHIEWSGAGYDGIYAR